MNPFAAPGSRSRDWTTRLVTLCALLLGLGTCSSRSGLPADSDVSPRSLVDMLPADSDVSPWTRAGDVQLVTDETGLYNRIDGGAPKYIDRGWGGTVFVEYRQGARSIQVKISDMGTEVNAQSIFNFSLPSSRQAINGLPNAVLDMSLTTSYGAFAYVSHYYVELNINEKADAARADIERFTNLILDRGT